MKILRISAGLTPSTSLLFCTRALTVVGIHQKGIIDVLLNPSIYILTNSLTLFWNLPFVSPPPSAPVVTVKLCVLCRVAPRADLEYLVAAVRAIAGHLQGQQSSLDGVPGEVTMLKLLQTASKSIQNFPKFPKFTFTF